GKGNDGTKRINPTRILRSSETNRRRMVEIKKTLLGKLFFGIKAEVEFAFVGERESWLDEVERAGKFYFE
ncbi:hypothetical protein RUM43_014636, partial [Polyplax serrata]